MLVKLKCGNFYTAPMNEEIAKQLLTEKCLKEFHHPVEMIPVEETKLTVITGGKG